MESGLPPPANNLSRLIMVPAGGAVDVCICVMCGCLVVLLADGGGSSPVYPSPTNFFFDIHDRIQVRKLHVVIFAKTQKAEPNAHNNNSFPSTGVVDNDRKKKTPWLVPSALLFRSGHKDAGLVIMVQVNDDSDETHRLCRPT
jgi:hypothetical protein